MLPEGFEFIRENISDLEKTQIELAQERVKNAELALSNTRLAFQNAMREFGVEGEFVLLTDQSGASHLARRKVEIPDAPVSPEPDGSAAD